MAQEELETKKAKARALLAAEETCLIGELTMPDMSAIAGALSSMKAAIDITKAMKDLRDWSLVQSKVIELQSAILDAQGSLFSANEERSALIGKISQLEKRVAGIEAWDTEKQRYALAKAGPGVFAYIVKPEMRGAEPAHYICAHCYKNGKAAILQHVEIRGMGDFLECSSCQTKTLIEKGYVPPK